MDVVTTEDEIQGVYDARHRPSLLIGVAMELLFGPSSSSTMQISCQFWFVRKHVVLPRLSTLLWVCCLSVRRSCHLEDKSTAVSLLLFTYLDPFLFALDKVVGTCKTRLESDSGEG